MNLPNFRRLIESMATSVPPEFLDGITAIDVLPDTMADPSLQQVWILGECIPVGFGDHDVTSRVVLYHGSFAKLAEGADEFDWRAEAWETLTHELRHHLEWRAGQPDLEKYDWAAEQNILRHDGEPFDPLFYQVGDRVAHNVTWIDDDLFLEIVREPKTWNTLGDAPVSFRWATRQYEIDLPEVEAPIVYVMVDGVDEPPDGEFVVVVRKEMQVRDLFKQGEVAEIDVVAKRIDVKNG